MFLQIIDEDERFPLPFGESTVWCRRLSRDAARDIHKRHTRRVQDWVNHQPVWSEKTDAQAENDDVLDHVIVGWEKVQHPVTRAELECTRENKLRLPSAAKIRIIRAAEALSLEDGSGRPEPEGGGEAPRPEPGGASPNS